MPDKRTRATPCAILSPSPHPEQIFPIFSFSATCSASESQLLSISDWRSFLVVARALFLVVSCCFRFSATLNWTRRSAMMPDFSAWRASNSSRNVATSLFSASRSQSRCASWAWVDLSSLRSCAIVSDFSVSRALNSFRKKVTSSLRQARNRVPAGLASSSTSGRAGQWCPISRPSRPRGQRKKERESGKKIEISHALHTERAKEKTKNKTRNE